MIDFTLTQYIQTAILGGLLGTGGMTLVLYAFDRAGLANGDMVRAVGTLITKNYENSILPGLVIHFLSGILFSIIYTIIIDAFNPNSIEQSIAYGIAAGVFHGAVVALMLVVAAEHHPIEKFQKATFSVAALHWGAHIVFGFIVGLIVGTTTI
jgi:hypothetical protein